MVGKSVRYFDEKGTTHDAIVVGHDEASNRATLVTVLDGRQATLPGVPHREERISVAEPYDLVHPTTKRTLGRIEGERRRGPGDYWRD